VVRGFGHPSGPVQDLLGDGDGPRSPGAAHKGAIDPAWARYPDAFLEDRHMLMVTLALLGCRNKDINYDSDPAVLLDSQGLQLADEDGDGFTEDEDCDDLDPAVNPNAEELCDGLDNNCDGVVDEDSASDAGTWYSDVDGDGYGEDGTERLACEQPEDSSAVAGDCDDLDDTVYPEAAERCDGLDNDCDGEVDEEVTDLWYADADGDGWGDASSTLDACDPPDGYAPRAGDCDDSQASVNPNGVELCNEQDDDCDGTVDEDDAVDAQTWYGDDDGDGYGGDTTTVACEQPSGSSADSKDCDDTDAAVNPGAAEVCNEVDDDCNGYVDDEDPGLTDGDTWTIDYDGDGYGDASGRFTATACEAPSGYVEDATDCDDTDADVFPSADETCNEIDDDCDGDVDEDDALDASTWYEDADGDTYGNASSTDVSCTEPRGYVSDDTDCDDTDADVYPGARETLDGVDEDCDGDIDDAWWVGDGADGAIKISGSTSLMDSGDIVVYGVDAISGADITADDTVIGIVAGDEVLILNVHGSDSAYSSVGTYEFGEVASISGTTITLDASVSGTYGETSNSDLSGQTVIVQRVPNFTTVDVEATGVLTTDAWDGSTGGVLAFRATDTVTIEAGGRLAVSEAGYSGGATGSAYNCDAYQGESYAGEGDGDGDGACSAYNESYGHWANNYGGGGAHITGAGGEYAGGATDGDSWTGGSATAPYAGDTYGDADLSTLFFGSGGGGVWKGSTTPSGGTPGPGGQGGGILFVAAFEIETQGATGLAAIGGSTDNAAQGSWTYGAGGGAGGSIYLMADTLTLYADSVDASGGAGESTHTRLGGDGGVGRIRLEYNELNGYAEGSSDASTEESSACDPDPGSSSAP
jgi:hypothetical protein